jgi:hypothetical protein
MNAHCGTVVAIGFKTGRKKENGRLRRKQFTAVIKIGCSFKARSQIRKLLLLKLIR